MPRPNYTVDPNTNRLTAPAGYTYGYDFAGNQANDTYTGAGARTFDAENRMTGSAGVSPASYKYSGGGQRVRRIVSGVETWQVYGLGGELLAEYAAECAPASPQKEYGYRNGQLLITSTASSGTPFVLTDNPLVPGVTTIKAIHLTELRTAVNQARAQAGLGAAIWTDASLTGVLIKATHVVELRVRLDEARIALGLSAASYLDPALSAGYTIKALHIQELRTRVQETQGGATINWLVADHLGTPRMIADQSGSLAGIRRSPPHKPTTPALPA